MRPHRSEAQTPAARKRSPWPRSRLCHSHWSPPCNHGRVRRGPGGSSELQGCCPGRGGTRCGSGTAAKERRAARRHPARRQCYKRTDRNTPPSGHWPASTAIAAALLPPQAPQPTPAGRLGGWAQLLRIAKRMHNGTGCNEGPFRPGGAAAAWAAWARRQTRGLQLRLSHCTSSTTVAESVCCEQGRQKACLAPGRARPRLSAALARLCCRPRIKGKHCCLMSSQAGALLSSRPAATAAALLHGR